MSKSFRNWEIGLKCVTPFLIFNNLLDLGPGAVRHMAPWRKNLTFLENRTWLYSCARKAQYWPFVDLSLLTICGVSIMTIFRLSSNTNCTSHSPSATGRSNSTWPWTRYWLPECFQTFVFSYFPSKPRLDTFFTLITYSSNTFQSP